VWVEQAIFTSIPRRGRAGYHIVARSPGVPEADATALATWAPSHGALIVDAANHTSVNFHPLPSGRLALSRTCEGPAEYSGRGEHQLYTHALIFDLGALQEVEGQPLALYRDALAQGHLRYRRDPDTVLKPLDLGVVHPIQDPQAIMERVRMLEQQRLDMPEPSKPAPKQDWEEGAERDNALPERDYANNCSIFEIVSKLARGQWVRFRYAGDRIAVAECLLGLLPPERVPEASFSTSLQPSAVRPYRLLLVN
jgi:GTPase-associated protein 1